MRVKIITMIVNVPNEHTDDLRKRMAKLRYNLIQSPTKVELPTRVMSRRGSANETSHVRKKIMQSRAVVYGHMFDHPSFVEPPEAGVHGVGQSLLFIINCVP